MKQEPDASGQGEGKERQSGLPLGWHRPHGRRNSPLVHVVGRTGKLDDKLWHPLGAQREPVDRSVGHDELERQMTAILRRTNGVGRDQRFDEAAELCTKSPTAALNQVSELWWWRRQRPNGH
ncbi:hypothetical protein [Mesorhizobium sp. M8A.F.Ca.ET.165.01.1.1]|uniref:hypothetical protein n=1 Tax=Mesorhizobium sp. M8A.F.Ca.ET.165.01.1.1 TaxID=2563960 RepID=UPI001093C114|nr:hypothetical protein [Mesorhizobium sp. M8A.F.Ca.ET.165.01.1.1]TGT42619.1 hypothetical protein EN808_12045 [Mesorhizobium sp. M8A.F.Ca.ET.165.01.1.1]